VTSLVTDLVRDKGQVMNKSHSQ